MEKNTVDTRFDHSEFARNYTTNFDKLRSLADEIINTCERKNREYGESFRLRAGPGAYFAYVRKPDRLETQVRNLNYDIFDVSSESEGTTESIDETIRDAIGYLLLILETREAIRESIERSEPQKAVPETPRHGTEYVL